MGRENDRDEIRVRHAKNRQDYELKARQKGVRHPNSEYNLLVRRAIDEAWKPPYRVYKFDKESVRYEKEGQLA